MKAPPRPARLDDAPTGATCWLLRKDASERAVCQLRWSVGDVWEIRLQINDALLWAVECRDQNRVLAAAVSWRRALIEQGWS